LDPFLPPCRASRSTSGTTRQRDIAKALESFDRELNEARRTSIYCREYQSNALVGAGYAHLAADDPAATDAFGRGLDLFPSNGRALVGLQQASGQASFNSLLTLLSSRAS
jgi:hypothetical protein